MRRIFAVFSWTYSCLFLVYIASHISAHHETISKCRLGLVLPPSIRLKLGQEEGLRSDCQRQRAGQGTFAWVPEAKLGYEICTRVFGAIADDERSSPIMTLCFPFVEDDTVAESLAHVLSRNAKRLGLTGAKSFSWPAVPATMMELSFEHDSPEHVLKDDAFVSKLGSAICETEKWVDDALCRLKLCPYTASLQRAAIGLETAGVVEGPVVIRHSQTTFSQIDFPAAALAAAFWQGVSELATQPESSVATLLIVGPESLDHDFREFAAICDELLEPTVQAVGACDIVGRAWFHPAYSADVIGHSSVLPGHALPSSMVQGFLDQYYRDTSYNRESMARANDAVRWTPHATINLLRRSQLTAAKKVEAAAANKKPNAVYARNVLRIIDDNKLLS